MKRVFFGLATVLWTVLGAFAQDAGTVQDDMKQAYNAMIPWLSEIDGGGYDQSWDDAGDTLQTKVSKPDWVAQLKQARDPLGPCRSRVQACLLPQGPLVMVQFKTDFENLRQAVETVTFERQDDGLWKAAGYFIKPG